MFVNGSASKLIGRLAQFLVVYIPLAIHSSADAHPRRHCSETIPTAVHKIIHELYPAFHIRTKKDSTHGCPGIVKVDFYGDGRAVYAVVIQKNLDDRGIQQDGKLLLASKGDNGWKVEILEDDGNPGSLWHAPADEFVDMYRGRTATAKGDIILYFGYESWERAYGWTGEKIEWVQLTD